jgi:hypothetical protein
VEYWETGHAGRVPLDAAKDKRPAWRPSLGQKGADHCLPIAMDLRTFQCVEVLVSVV